jgi:hypothetical protein
LELVEQISILALLHLEHHYPFSFLSWLAAALEVVTKAVAAAQVVCLRSQVKTFAVARLTILRLGLVVLAVKLAAAILMPEIIVHLVATAPLL